MTRIPLPATIDAAPAAARPFLEGVEKMLGSVPNLFRLTANSPSALEGYLGLNSALSKGALKPQTQTRERIALAVAQINGCDYCLSAHTYLAKNLAKLDDAEIAANRAGSSSDPKADAAVRFAVQLVQQRGHVASADVEADSLWRNRAETFTGRDRIVAFLSRKWAREYEYRLIKELWAFGGDRIAVRFA